MTDQAVSAVYRELFARDIAEIRSEYKALRDGIHEIQLAMERLAGNTQKIAKLETVVEQLESSRQRMIGVAFTIAALGGTLGGVISSALGG